MQIPGMLRAGRPASRRPERRAHAIRRPAGGGRKGMRLIDDAERRTRLARRHALAPQHRVQDAGAAIRAMTLLHATEPATPSTSGETRRISDVSNRSAIALRVQLFFLCDRLLDHLGFGIRIRIHVRPILSD